MCVSFSSGHTFSLVSPSCVQVMVFSNLFKFQPLAKELHDILTQLMEDENVEVCGSLDTGRSAPQSPGIWATQQACCITLLSTVVCAPPAAPAAPTADCKLPCSASHTEGACVLCKQVSLVTDCCICPTRCVSVLQRL